MLLNLNQVNNSRQIIFKTGKFPGHSKLSAVSVYNFIAIFIISFDLIIIYLECHLDLI